MWRLFEGSLLLSCFFCVLLPVLTREASFGKAFGFKRGHGFHDENDYDDGYAEFTGAEKRTLSEMQRRRFQNVQEDEGEMKRDSIHDLLLRELTRGENTETADEESPYMTDDVSNEENRFDKLRENSQHETLKEQIVDGVGTAEDNLALREEEEKQRKARIKKRLPKNGDLFEGDIVMDQRLRSWVTGESDKRDAINDVSYLWPASDDGTVRVPYTLSDEIQRDSWKMDSISKAVAAYNKYTCIRYVRLSESEEELKKREIVLDRVRFIINSSMCYSLVGRQGGKQDISIGNGCERLGTVLHEMMHTIGFIHEQSRPDRDKYIKVFYDNIQPAMMHNFEKYTVGQVEALPANKNFYDYDSCLHYNNHAFSQNDQDTIESIKDPSRRFGQREFFSKHDIEQINELYNCDVPHISEKLEDVTWE